ncbi:MAG: GTP cyclohydrolase I [Myxococcaceae bacterium]
MLELVFHDLLNKIGDDPKRLDLQKTPVMAAKAFTELTKGYALEPHLILKKDRIEAPANYNGTIEIPDIPFMSLCEHTFLPFLGMVEIAYEPRAYIAGAGAFGLVVEAFAKRLQLQERLNAEVAEVLFVVLEPKWLRVKMTARHCCMNGQEMRTQVMRGSC